jgi:glycosyltransferase 2 family protein
VSQLSPTDTRSRRRIYINLGLALLGVALLFVTIRRVGWTDVRSGLTQVGWWFLVLVALGGGRFAARARAWSLCARAMARTAPAGRAGVSNFDSLDANPQSTLGQGASSRFFLGAVLVADALGNLTPLGLLASEPAKILLLRNHVPVTTAIASVAAENAFYVASVVTVVATGAVVFINVTELPAGLRLGVQALFAAAAISACLAILVARRKPAALSRLAHTVSLLTGRARVSQQRLREVEGEFYGILEWPPTQIAHVAAWEGAFHVAAVIEVYLVLTLVPSSAETSLAVAFVLETTGRVIAVLFKFVPYRLGVDEAGTAVVAGALSLDPTVGVTLALLRRMRIVCWNAIGLAILARTR